MGKRWRWRGRLVGLLALPTQHEKRSEVINRIGATDVMGWKWKNLAKLVLPHPGVRLPYTEWFPFLHHSDALVTHYLVILSLVQE